MSTFQLSAYAVSCLQPSPAAVFPEFCDRLSAVWGLMFGVLIFSACQSVVIHSAGQHLKICCNHFFPHASQLFMIITEFLLQCCLINVLENVMLNKQGIPSYCQYYLLHMYRDGQVFKDKQGFMQLVFSYAIKLASTPYFGILFVVWEGRLPCVLCFFCVWVSLQVCGKVCDRQQEQLCIFSLGQTFKLKAAIHILDKSDTATLVRVGRIWRDSHFHELHVFPR